MNKRQYQIIALGIVIGSLLIVSIVSRLTATLLPGVATPEEGAVQAVAANDAAPSVQTASQTMSVPAPVVMQSQNATQPIAIDPAAPAFDPQPTLDTSGISVSGSDVPSADGQAARGEALPASTTGGVEPAPGQ